MHNIKQIVSIFADTPNQKQTTCLYDMNKRMSLTTLAFCWGIAAMAQQPVDVKRPVVVIDAETGVRIRDVQIFVNDNKANRIVTDYKGEFAIPDTARTLTMCHPKYEKRMMDAGEFTDSISLLPNYNRLNELVVIGRQPKISADIMTGVKQTAISVPQPKPLATFDFFSIFTAKKRKKTRQRIEAIKDY